MSRWAAPAFVAVLAACGGAAEPGPTALPTTAASSATPAASVETKPPPLCNGYACLVACEREHDPVACTRRAAELDDRMDPSLRPTILNLFARGCAARDPQACMELAVNCGRDMDGDGCMTAALPLLPPGERAACAKSDAMECTKHARAALFVQGYTLGEEGCKGRVPRACFLVAYSHEVGYGHEDHDVPTALVWYRIGCKGGDAPSCESLAVVLRQQAGESAPGAVPEADDADARAVELRDAHCAAGDAMECVNLARMLEDGVFPAGRDPERAEALRARACVLKNEGPCP